jgi:hypothetical protein
VANVVVLLAVLLLAWYVGSVVRGRRASMVPKRVGVAADLGELLDKPRVRVRAVTSAGPGRVRLVLTPEPGPEPGPAPGAEPGRGPARETGPGSGAESAPGPSDPQDLDLVVLLREDEFGYQLLGAWQRSQSSLAIVTLPDSRIVRLRAIDDLQPLSLRLASG